MTDDELRKLANEIFNAGDVWCDVCRSFHRHVKHGVQLANAVLDLQRERDELVKALEEITEVAARRCASEIEYVGKTVSIITIANHALAKLREGK